MKYKDLQCLDVQANSIRVNTAKDFYIGVSTNELRVTNNLFGTVAILVTNQLEHQPSTTHHSNNIKLILKNGIMML